MFVADLLHPVNSLAVETFLNGNVRHGGSWAGPVPVFLTRLEPDHVARSNFLDRATPALRATEALRHNQGLAQRVSMPVGVSARLLDAPDEAPILMPLIRREIIYRLLKGEQGGWLRHLAILSGYTPDIARAIERLRRDFDRPMRIEQMARELGMSVSAFHHHFNAVTALSPLQFQKRLRLLEARRLMLSEDLDAASAAFRVGYLDASHFNREYKNLLGFPPMRDMQRLREAALKVST